jgi:hypothetical protein
MRDQIAILRVALARKATFFAGLDLDRFTGRRIAAYAGSAIPHSQNSETSDLHLFALLKMLPDHSGQLFQHFPTLLLGELMLLGQRIGKCLVVTVEAVMGLCSLGALCVMGFSLMRFGS